MTIASGSIGDISAAFVCWFGGKATAAACNYQQRLSLHCYGRLLRMASHTHTHTFILTSLACVYVCARAETDKRERDQTHTTIIAKIVVLAALQVTEMRYKRAKASLRCRFGCSHNT